MTITDGPMAGLLSRAVVVVGPDGNVAYTEQVPEIAQEPDYDAALGAPSAGTGTSWPIRRQRSRSASRPTVRPAWSATCLQARMTPGMKLARS